MTYLDLKEGETVLCRLVTGERAVGIYRCKSPETGSYLIENASVEGGLKADYVWASAIEDSADTLA